MEKKSLLENYRTAFKFIEKEALSVIYDKENESFLFVLPDNDPAWELLSELHDPAFVKETINKEFVDEVNQFGEFQADQINTLREYLRFFWLLDAGVVDFCFAEAGEKEEETPYSTFTDFDGQRIFLLFRNDCAATTPVGKRDHQHRGLKEIYLGGGLGELISNECAFKGLPEPSFNVEMI